MQDFCKVFLFYSILATFIWLLPPSLLNTHKSLPHAAHPSFTTTQSPWIFCLQRQFCSVITREKVHPAGGTERLSWPYQLNTDKLHAGGVRRCWRGDTLRSSSDDTEREILPWHKVNCSQLMLTCFTLMKHYRVRLSWRNALLLLLDNWLNFKCRVSINHFICSRKCPEIHLSSLRGQRQVGWDVNDFDD